MSYKDMLVTSASQCLFPMETYEELVQKGLAVKSVDTEKGLVTYKYARKVMFENLWKSHPALMECRGVVFDIGTKKLVALPVRKSFNYGENGWWDDVPLGTKVVLYKKYNGFMGAVTENICSTTGSTKSDFVKIISKHVSGSDHSSSTDLYEIVDETDPHIINEKLGAYFLGTRDHYTGDFYPSDIFSLTTLRDALQFVDSDNGEGFMCYLEDDYMKLSPCKLKTPYYVGKKRMMRMKKSEVEQMYNGIVPPRLHNWRLAIPAVCSDIAKDAWLSYNDQTRRKLLEHYWDAMNLG